jgi:hypothetical protein
MFSFSKEQFLISVNHFYSKNWNLQYVEKNIDGCQFTVKLTHVHVHVIILTFKRHFSTFYAFLGHLSYSGDIDIRFTRRRTSVVNFWTFLASSLEPLTRFGL